MSPTTTNSALRLFDYDLASTEEVLVELLKDGEVFSVDGGATWHVCCIVMFDTVAVYLTADRDPDTADTIRIDADSESYAIVASPRKD